MRVARWHAGMIGPRTIGALGALAPTACIGALFIASGSLDTIAPSLWFVGLIAGLAGGIAGPATVRPRGRPLRRSLAFALAALALWAAVGTVDIVLSFAAGGADLLETLSSLVLRVILIAAYGAFALVPLWVLGTTWVVMTWFLDGLLGGERSGEPAP